MLRELLICLWAPTVIDLDPDTAALTAIVHLPLAQPDFNPLWPRKPRKATPAFRVLLLGIPLLSDFFKKKLNPIKENAQVEG